MRKCRRYSVSVLLLLFFGSLSATAQDSDWNRQISQLSGMVHTQTSGDYRLGPGDLLEIKVYGADGLGEAVRISSSGAISLPYLGRMQVSDMTPAELEEHMAALITEKKLVRDPQVSVFISEYRSQAVFVLGAVRQPGQYVMTRPFRMIDALALAGGLVVDRAADYALLQRQVNADQESPPASSPSGAADGSENQSMASGPPPKTESISIRIGLEELLEKGNLALNIPIQGGDVIQVPERELTLFYIIGEVGRPGAYELADGEPLLLSQALAWAGGPRNTAKADKGILLRYEGAERKEIKVDFGAIIKGKKPDLQVQAEDVIFIPGSKIKTIGYGLLGVIPTTVSGASTAIYRRRY